MTVLTEHPRAFQTQAEVDRVVSLYRERRPRRVLEIGVAEGGTLHHWARNAVPDTVIVAVDRFEADLFEVCVDNRALFDSWLAPGADLAVVTGSSTDPAVVGCVRSLGPYEWVHIDGDHSYETASSDWNIYGLGMAAPGAVVLLHDIAYVSESSEVRRLWGDIVAAGYRTDVIVVESDPTLGYGVVWM